MKRQLNLVLNGKGGVGKSFFAVNFVQYLKDQGIQFVACDSDNENSTLKRFHPEAEFLNLSDSRGLDGMFRALERVNLVVVDCRAASTELLLRFFTSVDLRSVLRLMNARACLIMPVNHEADSVEQIQRWVDALSETARFVIVRNQVHSETFALFDQSAVRVRLLKKLGAKELTMPRLEEWLVQELSLTNLTVTAGLTHPGFFLLDRQRLAGWQRRLYSEIQACKHLLIPEQPETPDGNTRTHSA